MRARLSHRAEQEIAAAAKAARRQLTAHAADLAVGLAQKQIHVDAATDQALVRNFAGAVGSGLGQFGKGRKLGYGFRRQHLRPSLRRRGFQRASGCHPRQSADCARLRRCLSESADLRRVWENPAVPAEQKRKLLDAIVQREGIDKPVRNLVAVLIDHRRLPFLPRIVEQFEKELDARMGFAEAQISSARELGDAEKRALEAQIAKMTGKKVRAQLWTGSVVAGRRSGSHRQHDLRRFGERAVGED